MEMCVTTIAKSKIPETNPLGYLLVNPDVQRAGVDPVVHKRNFGISEGRQEFLESSILEINNLRIHHKKSFIDEILLPEMTIVQQSLFGDYQTEKYFSCDKTLPVVQSEVGLNSYDTELDIYFESHPNEWWLDMGAGLREKYRSNVIYTEISDLPTTDVICYGENLPFKNESFNGVVCLAVLEHVVNPQIVFDELVRVTKPGGRIIIDWPFLQPYHGHPFHFYNATSQGVQQLVRNNPDAELVDISVPDWLHPIHTLQWIIRDWISGIPKIAKDDFLELSLAEIASCNPYELIQNTTFGNLSEESKSAIAAGHRVTVLKS
jgi:SAM-dependent methyltransferase